MQTLKPCPFCGGEAAIEQTGKNELTLRCVGKQPSGLRGCGPQFVQKVKFQSLEWLEGVMAERWNARNNKSVNLDILIGNLLDRWEMTPNDLKAEMREHGCGKQLDALMAGSTRPAAPVEGLETVAKLGGIHGVSLLYHIQGMLPSAQKNYGEELVTRSQAEAIIAAERKKNAKLQRYADSQRERVQEELEEGSRLRSKITDLETDNAALTARVKELEAIIEGDRTKVIDLVNAISDAFTRRSWMLTSRGSYEWDDDGFRKEFGDAMEEIGTHVNAMRAIGIDWSNCPVKAEEIAEARIDWCKKAKALEAKLAAADKAARAAHDTLIEINQFNYTHEDVCELNDASVEAIFLLADIIGETHGKTKEWWDERRAALSEVRL